jgi:uroporphyrinogen decarboxylase
MNKRDAILSVVDSSKPYSYIPAAFFLHFPDEFHTGRAAVEKHLEYFRYTNMDLLKIQYEGKYPTLPEIQSPADWLKMPYYGREFYEGQLEAVEGLVKTIKHEAVVVVTLYSPFMCAVHSTSDDIVTKALNTEPELIKKALETITESLLLFVRECIKLGVDGFYTSTQGGEIGRFNDPTVFDKYIKPYDLVLMDEANRECLFNILHVCDYHLDYDDFGKFVDYPGTVVNAPLKVGNKELTPKEAAQFFKRPYMGGLERKGIITNGTPDQIRQNVEKVIEEAPERFILAADCTVPSEVSWDNLKYVIDLAHNYRRNS